MKNQSPKQPSPEEAILERHFPETKGLQYPWVRSEDGLDENDTHINGCCVE